MLDQNSAVLSGVTVNFSVNPSSGVLSRESATTGSNGEASTTLRLGNTAGTYTVTASVSGLSSVTFTATATDPPLPPSRIATTLEYVSGRGQEALIDEQLAKSLVVRVLDQNGAVLLGVTVSFTVSPISGVLNPASATTDATGEASTELTLGDTAGSYTVTARVSDIAQPVTFTATATNPDPNDPNPSGHNPPDNVLSHYVDDSERGGWIVWVYYPANYVKDDNEDGEEDNPRGLGDDPIDPQTGPPPGDKPYGFTMNVSGGDITNFSQTSGICKDADNDDRDDYNDVPCSTDGSDYSVQFFVKIEQGTEKITLTLTWTHGMYAPQVQTFNIMKEISMKDWDQEGYDPGHTNQEGW